MDMKAALAEGATKVHDDLTSNLCYDWGFVEDNKAAVDEAFDKAAHHITLDLVNNRLVANPMEPRVAVGDYDPWNDHHTLYTTSQNPHVIRLLMGAFRAGHPRTQAARGGARCGRRVRVQDLSLCRRGVLHLCRQGSLKRPVKWTSSRSEAFMSDAHGRDHVTKMELALDADHTSPPSAPKPMPTWGPICRPSRRRSRPGCTAR
jgi:aerobic carbon-monoxide dehydrogenase large subunit